MFLIVLTSISSEKLALADVVSPPPEECIEGASPTTSHCGPHCTDHECGTGCEDGLECRELPLCVQIRECTSGYGTFSETVIHGSCETEPCEESEAECLSMTVCADPIGEDADVSEDADVPEDADEPRDADETVDADEPEDADEPRDADETEDADASDADSSDADSSDADADSQSDADQPRDADQTQQDADRTVDADEGETQPPESGCGCQFIGGVEGGLSLGFLLMFLLLAYLFHRRSR